MFFITYLRRELRRRMRQAIFIGIGLAVGVGLVITVMGASAGVKNAQSKVLSELYGVGTDLAVTTKPQPPSNSGTGQTIRVGVGGGGVSGQNCVNGKCTPIKSGDVIDTLADTDYGTLTSAEVTAISRLHDVKSAVGNLSLTDNRIVIPTQATGTLPQPTDISVDGVDPAHENAGPLSDATLAKGRNLTSTDRYDALVDANYATAHNLTTGDTITLAGSEFTIVGTVTQPEATSPPNAYIPLRTAQALAIDPATGKSMKNDVDTVYITAASASDIAAVQREIQHLLPGATVTSSASLASEITGSLASTAKLANELGKWLAILVLIAAFAVASLLTLGAVSRRTPEFGTLKALGWRSSRIVSQVLGESVSTGIAGGLAGIGLGFAGVAIFNKAVSKLTAIVPSATSGNGGPQTSTGGAGTGPVIQQLNPAAGHATLSVPMSAPVTLAAILLAVLLAVAGGLLAGSFGGWRAARLRPATALTKVG
jgi:putative ABC transport system permease protein